MTWLIDKTFEFCYGHRVHTQTLNGDYAADLKCACRHMHGHEAKVQVFLSSDTLDHTGMVTDFRHLEWLKKWINQYIDHQFILDNNDPLFGPLLGDSRLLVPVMSPGTEDVIVAWNPDLSDIPVNTPFYEFYEGFLVVDFVPTSENLAKWMFDIAQTKMKKIGVKVERVDWWETPKSRSSYSSVDSPTC